MTVGKSTGMGFEVAIGEEKKIKVKVYHYNEFIYDLVPTNNHSQE